MAQALRGNDVEEIALLDEFFHGYPVEQLRRLFASENDNAVRMGAWIASELGRRATPLVDDLVKLTRHPVRSARFWAVDALLGIGSLTADSTAAAVKAIDDPDSAVRWKAMHFLARARPKVLSAGVNQIGDRELDRLLSWLMEVDTRSDARATIQLLRDTDQRTRLFAAAAAARLADRHTEPLHEARASTDPEVSEFAKDYFGAPPQ